MIRWLFRRLGWLELVNTQTGVPLRKTAGTPCSCGVVHGYEHPFLASHTQWGV